MAKGLCQTFFINYADFIWRDSHNWAISTVDFQDVFMPCTPEIADRSPELTKLREKWPRYLFQRVKENGIQSSEEVDDDHTGNNV